MIIHSDTTKSFILKVKKIVKHIVAMEMNLKMDSSRILYQRTFYPLNIVVFEDQTRLGYFDSRFYELGISKKLMLYAKEEVLFSIVRHELAHFFCFIKYGHTQSHGEEFKTICREFHWGSDVSNAYMNIDLANEEVNSSLANEKLLEKIKKLLKLASSTNPHESELATIKANALLLEHNLSTLDLNERQEEVYVERVLEGSRKNSKHLCIYEILKTFFVSPVFNHGKGYFYLEVIGDKTNTELAQYVANFLDHHLDVLWQETKKQNTHFKSVADKNAFFNGVARGYVEKIKAQNLNMAESKDLIVLENKLQTQLKQVYSRLGKSMSRAGFNNEAAQNLGVEKGKKLSINPGVGTTLKKIFLLN